MPKAKNLSRKKPNRPAQIILGVTGSIAAYRAAEIISAGRKRSLTFRCVMTAAANRFITPLTLRTLSDQPVYTELFSAQPDPAMATMHVSLSDWADAILIAPATANCIGKIAHGIADDILTCVALSSAGPLVVAPAMNTRMYAHPAVKENIAVLKKRGVSFIGPRRGRLACGIEGMGHIASTEDILSALQTVLP